VSLTALGAARAAYVAELHTAARDLDGPIAELASPYARLITLARALAAMVHPLP
jgi:hypothetical protein